jgi:hypothetical protein
MTTNIDPSPSQMWMILHQAEQVDKTYLQRLRDIRQQELDSDNQPNTITKVVRWDLQIKNDLANWMVTAIRVTRKQEIFYQIDLLGIDNALPRGEDENTLLCPILRTPREQGLLEIDNWGEPTLIQLLEQAQIIRCAADLYSLCGLLT